MRSAFARLSQRRIEDTLMAEYGPDVQKIIKAFRNSKSDQSEDSLCTLFGVEPTFARDIATVLIEIGFFEQIGDIFRIPILYREGLNISKGRAYH